MLVYVLFFSGFVILILGASLLVNGASTLGTRFKIPEVVIGLTIVALGTSLPEMVINVFAAIRGDTDLAISNIAGSNIMNILFIVGISAAITPLKVLPKTTWIEIPFSMFATVLFGLLIFTSWGSGANTLSRLDGAVLLAFFAGFIIYTFRFRGSGSADEADKSKQEPLFKALIFIILGFILLFLGGQWIVNGTETIAELLGFAQSEVGLIIIATATSLPELATSVVAAFKKKAGIAIGNAIGSCIFNILLVLGISAMIRPLPLYDEAVKDLFMMILSSLLLFVFVFTFPGRKINRGEGVFMVLLYLAFVYYRIFL